MADDRRAFPTRTDELRATLDDGVLTLILHRPEARNALSLPLLDGLAAALDDAHQRDDVRVVVLTGAGNGFCAGGDVKTMARGESTFGPMDDPDARIARQIAAQRATSVRLWDFPKPTVALVNGSAVGAGLALALACDLRYATASAVLRTGFLRAGLAGDFGCTWLLTTLVGPARAAELMYLSPALSAARAEQLGLVNGVFPDDRFADEGAAVARSLAAAPAQAVEAIAANLERARRADLAECADAEVRWHVGLLGTPEQRAAVEAVAATATRPPTGDVAS